MTNEIGAHDIFNENNKELFENGENQGSDDSEMSTQPRGNVQKLFRFVYSLERELGDLKKDFDILKTITSKNAAAAGSSGGIFSFSLDVVNYKKEKYLVYNLGGRHFIESHGLLVNIAEIKYEEKGYKNPFTNEKYDVRFIDGLSYRYNIKIDDLIIQKSPDSGDAGDEESENLMDII